MLAPPQRRRFDSYESRESDDDDDYVPLSIVKQLTEINKKLSNVITKSDTSLLKSLIKDTKEQGQF